jgi:arylsulfatase A-like enzyme
VRRLVLLLLGATLGCAQGAPPDPRPNVLLITIDTLRADRLGSYGYELDTSPHIDALAAQGVLFERAIAAAATTAPTHASIMSAKYVREHSIGPINHRTRLADATHTLAETFRAAGWATGAVVGNMTLARRTGLDQGFQHYDDEMPSQDAIRPSIYEKTARETTARAQEWLRAQGPEPFFLWVHYQDPHGPYAPPESHRGRFRIPPRAGERPLPVLRVDSGEGGIPAYQALEDLSLPSQYEASYADEIFFADEGIGALLQAVDGHPSRRRAVVLLTADHGESLGEARRFFVHGFSTTPQLAHVPMLLRAPGIEPERRADPVHHVDVMPTLLELAGIEAPDGLSGLALGPFLRDGAPLPDRYVYCDIGSELSAYRGTRFTRVLGLEAAWIHLRDPQVTPPDPSGSFTYEWTPGERWELVDTGDSIAPQVRRYFLQATPLERLSREGTIQTQRLRALGYVWDEEPAPLRELFGEAPSHPPGKNPKGDLTKGGVE